VPQIEINRAQPFRTMKPRIGPTNAAWVAVLLACISLRGQTVFRTSTDTVPVYPTVVDREGRLVPNLTRDEFVVVDNGRPTSIATFSNVVIPITVVLLIDTSGSMSNKLLRVRAAAGNLVNALGSSDRLRVASFGGEVSVNPWLTNEKTILQRVLKEELWIGSSTPLWHALDRAMVSLAGESGRRVLLIVTDGKATDAEKRSTVRPAILKDQFMVYAIGVQGNGLSDDLTSLAEETGGGHFVLRDADGLEETFKRVLDELRHQYAIGFTPVDLDDTIHKLRVQTTDRSLKVRSATTYVASKQRH
jgi:VWFA-related protein